jgi:hypothetical protein
MSILKITFKLGMLHLLLMLVSCDLTKNNDLDLSPNEIPIIKEIVSFASSIVDGVTNFVDPKPEVKESAVASVAPSSLSYTVASPSYGKGQTISNNSPSVTGTVDSYSISPSLPAGLSLDTTTGIISGTPAVASAATDYTVTATNSIGSTSVVLNITVTETAPVASAISPAAFDEDTQSVITLSYSDAEADEATACTISSLSNVTVTQACACAAGNCTVGVTGTANYNGAASFNYTVTAGGQTSAAAAATLSISAINDAPTISNLSDESASVGVNSSSISFTIADIDSTVECGTHVTKASSNTTVLPVANITIGGGATQNCTVVFNGPTTGTSNVTLTVTDSLAASDDDIFTATIVSITTQTFLYTGSTQSFVVPSGVTSISVKAWGAGGAGADTFLSYPGSGGGGGAISFNLGVTPGETLLFVVGGGGNFNNAGGYNGGGEGAFDLNQQSAGGGGGMSSVRSGATVLAAAAGGGGGGGSWTTTLPHGGPGGGATGTNGTGVFGANTLGNGATASAGGAASTACAQNSTAGSAGLGGVGGYITSEGDPFAPGGGGGGGYYGGSGGGCSSGGGGGSSLAPGNGSHAVSSLTHFSGSGTTAGNNADPDKPANVGTGGAAGANGSPGAIFISY